MEIATDILIRKGKRETAAYIQAACSSENNSVLLNDLLDIFLDPSKPIDDCDALDWCRWIIAGGKTLDEFSQIVKRYDSATTCGFARTSNFVAYRCRTCCISPYMLLCPNCFQSGNHKDHDFNMIRNQAGGTCDCGDKSVMKESGFCQKHGLKSQHTMPEAPHDLLCVAMAFMPRAFLRLLQYLRDCYKPDASGKDMLHVEAEGLLDMLRKNSELGSTMREVMTHALTNSQIYASLALCCDSSKLEKVAYFNQNIAAYKEALLSSNDPNSYKTSLEHKTFLDELMFWTVKYKFPQKLVGMLLNMMPDLRYKDAFTKTFVHHYSEIGKMLKSSDSETLPDQVAVVSSQLFSNEDLAFKMTVDFSFLHIIIENLTDMILSISCPSSLQYSDENFHFVVDCSKRIIKKQCYWPLISDFNIILTHKLIALKFISDKSLLQKWFSLLSLFQGMNVNQRELKLHLEFDSNTYCAAFTAEHGALATPMWELISHLKDQETVADSKNTLGECLTALKRWMQAIGFNSSQTMNPYQVSFHLPLHRYFAAFLCQAMRYQGVHLSEIIPSFSVLRLIMMHPLQVQVAFHEILAGMWVRCGLQIKGQAMTYIRCYFCNSTVDADLFLLQLCAMYLDSDWFLKTVFQRFHVYEWFTFHPNRVNSFLDSEQVLPMLEGALTFIATLVTMHTNIGLTQEEVTRQEMVSLLCMEDRTHSQLMDLLPKKCSYTTQGKDFESILTKVADYKAPNFEVSGAMVHGMFSPKPEIWEKEYDPIHLLLRTGHRQEYQASLDCYAQYLQQSGKFSGMGTPWPPYRIPAAIDNVFEDPRTALQSTTMHALIFTVLYRVLNDPDVPERILALIIYLLELSVRFPSSTTTQDTSPTISKDLIDLDFINWFPGNDILTNISILINRILITDNGLIALGMAEEGENTDVTFGVHYQVQSSRNEQDNPEKISNSTTLQNSITHLVLPSSDTTTALVPLELSAESLKAQLAIQSQEESSAPSNSVLFSALIANFNLSQLASLLDLENYGIADQGFPLTSSQNSETASNSAVKDMHCWRNRVVEVNESILSLLIALYSKLAEKPDAYSFNFERAQFLSQNDLRIGNGVDFIGRLLDRIVLSGPDKEVEVTSIRQRLWPQSEATPPLKIIDYADKQERKRKAKERQERLMAEFASKQKAFLQKTMETETKDVAQGDDLGEMHNMRKEYECVICGQTTVSDAERPMGMVVLLQSTSVLGHTYQESARHLPCCDGERFQSYEEKTLAYYMNKRFTQLALYFDNKYWQSAVNIRWEGGVYVQSCGHYLHIDCQKSYMQSLKCQNNQFSLHQNVNVEQGEYSCPLCRQLANSVIPLNPALDDMSSIVCCRSDNLHNLAAELSQLMTSSLSEKESNLIKVHMHGIMKDLTNSTYPQYRSVCSHDSSTLFLFLCSIARTNLEIELIQRDAASNINQKACFLPLLHVLSLHSRVLTQSVPVQIWTRLTGQTSDANSAVNVVDTQVPLLLHDCIAILLQIILKLPLNIDKIYFRCVVQVLYNIVFLQSVIQLTQLMYWDERLRLKHSFRMNKDEYDFGFVDIFELLVDTFEKSSLYLNDGDRSPLEKTVCWMEENIENHIQKLCIHFLRIASLLQNHLYSESITVKSFMKNEDQQKEFGNLCFYLGLSSNKDPASITSTSCLNWVTNDPALLVKTWCCDFVEFVNTSSIAARKLLERPMIWFPPALLQLPENYDQIFQYHHRRLCHVCHSMPKDPSLCLVCGTIVCLQENCCRQQAQYEAVLHSVACGAGTALYLAVNSSIIIVICGKRACLWGSVYLDSFGEEDRDLKRGKPLFLSKERYNLLQNQWLNHSFNHTNKRWVWHEDNL